MENKLNRPATNGLTRLYLAVIYFVTVATIAILLRYLGAYDASLLLAAAMAACLLVLVSHPAIAVTNSLIRQVVKQRALPTVDLGKGLGVENRTLVVIPDLLMGESKIDALVDNLHQHFLRNHEPDIYFGLLTDWVDAAAEHLPADEGRLAHVLARIRALNVEHGADGRRPFFLLHRGRRWNSYDDLWMGYERKRGKLEDLNDFILHGNASSFLVLEGDVAEICKAKYVITLDNDTLLPKGAAVQLISTIAHPANTPEFDDNGVIVSGHAILQPRMLATMPENASSWYERFRVRQRGTNPCTPSFDIFQDFFGEGCFTGVGIYAVAPFYRSLRDMIPENYLLSHDIVEGGFARSGRVANVSLFESMPPTFHASSRRHHRWTRGDWQNSAWLFPSVPCAEGARKNTFNLLSKWKIFKCMNASLFSLCIMLIPFLCAVTDKTEQAILLASAAVALPMLVDMLLNVFHGKLPKVRTIVDTCAYTVMMVTLAPFEGLTNLDAAVRAIYRIRVSRRRSLEWVPSSEYENDDIGLRGYWRYMWKSPAIAVLLAAWLWLWSAHWTPLVDALLCAWALAPLFAWHISRRLGEPAMALIGSAART